MGPGDQLFGRYRIVRWIAAGGMGTVWEARDEVLEQAVALKHVSFAGSPAEADTNRRRTLREARNAARLRGEPDVVAIYDVQERDGDVWLVLEYLPSRSLAQVLDGGEPLGPAVVARIGTAVARALAAAHASGITHRDVKPGNVLIASRDGAAKLTDFGISHAEGDANVTATGLLSGTPAFMAPEVARGDEAGPPADVFSLGATLYAAVEGAPPFGNTTNPRALIHRVANDPVPPPTRAGPLTPLLVRMLDQDPRRRPDATTTARLLREFAQGSGPTAVAPSWPVPEPAPPARRRRAGRWVLAAAGVAVLVAVAAFAGARFATPSDPPAAPPEDTSVLPASVGPIAVTGDARTVDACRLIDPGPMRRFGEPELDVTTMPQGCGLRLNSGTDRYAYLDVQFSNVDPTTPDGPVQRVGDVTVRRGSTADDDYGTPQCLRRVVLADSTSLLVRVQSSATDRPALCDVAEVATVSVVRYLARSGVPYDAARNARYSLARTDACSLLDDSAVVPVIGPGPRHYAGFGAWNCTWRGKGSVMVTLNGGDSDPSGFGRPIRIAGRDAFEQEATDGCRVTVVHRAAPSPTERSDLLQMTLLREDADRTVLCARARELATAAENRASGA